jgi:hypothetical protein
MMERLSWVSNLRQVEGSDPSDREWMGAPLAGNTREALRRQRMRANKLLPWRTPGPMKSNCQPTNFKYD